jgi:hypothetical protein
MATVNDVLAAIEHVKVCSDDPKAWLIGLTSSEVSDVATIFAVSSHRVDALLAKIRRQHPDLFDPMSGAMIVPATKPGAPSGKLPPGGASPDRQEGRAAAAMRDAEAALAHQNSATAQLDLQVITAILNAHLKTVEGAEALSNLQQDIEAAVRTRTDLDTPAGARDFQQFLIRKLRDIHAVVASANLDDTSKSALMAAWTSLYNASKTSDRSESRPAAAAAAAAPARSPAPSTMPDPELDPYFGLDSLLGDDPGLLPGDPPAQITPAPTSMPSIPNFGGGMMPGGGALPSSMPGWGMPGGFPFPGPLGTGNERPPKDHGEALVAAEGPTDAPSHEDPEGNSPDDDADDADPESQSAPEPPSAAPTTVTLPNGDTVTAASPQLAAAIKAAAGGTPIPDAFRQQGITIPPPGTAVADPVDPSRLTPGDIGIFADHHALALGNSKALLNGQIHHISTVKGPGFLGWEHPPTPAAATAPTRTEAPTPTRPATTTGTSV